MKTAPQAKSRLTSTLKFIITSVKDAGDDCIIEGYANTSDKDRVGDVVLPAAFEKSLPTYQKNPILLNNHNWDDPIGIVTYTEITDKGLFIRAKISSTRPDIKTLIGEGVLSTFSIGYNEVEADFDENTKTKYIKELELLEISVVTVPANPEARFTQTQSAPAPAASDAPAKSAKNPAKTAKDLRTFIETVKSVLNESLDETQVVAICDYFNSNEELMTREQLLEALRKKSASQGAAAPKKKDGEPAEPPKPAEEAPADDDDDDDKIDQEILAKLGAVAEAVAQILERLDKLEAAKPADDKPAADKDKPADDKPAGDDEKAMKCKSLKADGSECGEAVEKKDDGKMVCKAGHEQPDADKEDGEMKDEDVEKQLAEVEAQLADLEKMEDAENA